MSKSKDWTREETIVAFNMYCKIPFKSSSKTNPSVVKYANMIERVKTIQTWIKEML